MKKNHLLAIVCASALLPIGAASAQSCGHGSYSGGHGYSRGYNAPSHSYGQSSRSYGGSHGYSSSRCSYGGGRSCSHRGYSSGCGNDRIRLISGYQRGKGTRPSGWHDKRWFSSRGYKLDNYSHVHKRSGAVHRGSRSSYSRSSSHRGHGH